MIEICNENKGIHESIVGRGVCTVSPVWIHFTGVWSTTLEEGLKVKT
jgi:hypothetical protein